MPELAALDVEVIALSVDPPERSTWVRDHLQLPFLLLCDPNREVVEAWGLLNTREHGGIAFPAVFVIDRDRTVRYRSLDRTASRVNAEAVVAFLRSGVPAVGVPARTVIWPGFVLFFQAIFSGLLRGFQSPRAR